MTDVGLTALSDGCWFIRQMRGLTIISLMYSDSFVERDRVCFLQQHILLSDCTTTKHIEMTRDVKNIS